MTTATAKQPIWRTWTELSDPEGRAITRCEHPPSLMVCVDYLWLETPDGWLHKDRTDIPASELA